MNEKRLYLMTEAPVMSSIIKMSLPVIMGMMVQVLYNLVDIFFVGMLHDPYQLAAVNLSTPIVMLMTAIAALVGTGAASYISRTLGEHKSHRASQILSTGVIFCVGLGLTVTLLGTLCIETIVWALGADTHTFVSTHNYVSLIFLGSIFMMCNYALGQLLRAEGAMMPSMLGMFIGTMSNLVLDPIFIFGFGMGVTGAAIATVLGNLMAVFFYIFYYRTGKSALELKPNLFSTDFIIWKEILTIGTPSSLNQSLVILAMILCNNVAASYSVDLVAGMGISSKITTFGTFVFMGISAGCQPMIGYNYGAQNFDRLTQIVKKGITLTTCVGLTLTLIFGVGAPWIIGIFTPLPEVQQMGVHALRITMLSLPFVGSQMLSASTIQAMGKALPGLFLSIARQGLFYIPLLYTLNHTFAENGFLFAQPISDFITLCISLTILTTLLRRLKRPQ